MGKYVALLRGINVGGKNLIKMTELAACFEKQGFRNVVTYIQSGNVIFETSASAKLVEQIESILAKTFGYRASIVLRSQKQLRDVVTAAPKGFGSLPARYRYDVMYLKPALKAVEAIQTVPTQKGVDQVYAGPGVLYFSRLTSKASQSRLSRIVSMPIYQSMTIRNWNTTTTLLGMMEDTGEPPRG